MALFTLASASGSPGVTTTALALALSWPRPVTLVEADPTGGSAIQAGYFKGGVDHPGLLNLVIAHRHGQLAASLPGLLVPIEGTNARLLVGTKSHEQAVGLLDLWEPLLVALRELAGTGQDVIVDAGRLGLDGAPMPLVWGADVTALVSRTSLPALAAARSWATALTRRSADAAGCVLVGEGRPYRASEVRRVLGIPCFAGVAWDPGSARVFSDGAPYPQRGLFRGDAANKRSFGRSAWHRSLLALGSSLRNRAGERAASALELLSTTGGE